MAGKLSNFQHFGGFRGRHWAEIQHFKGLGHKLPKKVQVMMPTESNLKTDTAQPPKCTKSRLSVYVPEE